MTENWGRTYVVVTGASKGFGAQICKQLSLLLKKESLILGIARSQVGLDETKKAVDSLNPNIKFIASPVDLQEASNEELKNILKESLQSSNMKFDTCVIIHNAGSLGPLEYLKKLNNINELNDFFKFNISSTAILNSEFLSLVENMETKPKVNIINISSLCATVPFKSSGLYCISKAARLMYFKVLASEEKNINVLNYCPGPLKGEMQQFLREKSADPEVRDMFIQMHKEEKLVDMKVSVDKLLKILGNEGKYSSGDSIDYFDDI